MGRENTSDVEALTTCLSSILGLEVTPTTSLFTGGGTSIHAEIFAREATALLGVPVTFTDVFLHPTPEQLAHSLAGIPPPAAAPTAVTSLDPFAWHPLSESQFARLAAQDRSAVGIGPRSRPQLVIAGFDLRGRIDLRAFRDAVRLTVRRHDSLRSRIAEVDGEWRLTTDDTAYDLVELDGTHLTRTEIYSSLTSALPLDAGVMGRFAIVRYSPDHNECWIVLEHFVTDRVASRIIHSDLADAYSALVSGADKSDQSPSGIPSFAWPYYEDAACRSERGSQAEAFWLETFGTRVARGAELPGQRPYDRQKGRRVRRSISLGLDNPDALSRFAQAHHTTVHALMVCGLARAVSSLSQRCDISIYWYAANRDVREAAQTTTWMALLTGIRLPALPTDLASSRAYTASAVASAAAYGFYPLVRLAREHDYADRFPPYESPRLLLHVDDVPSADLGSAPPNFHGLQSTRIPFQDDDYHGFSIDTRLRYRPDGPSLELTHREETLSQSDSEELLEMIAAEVRCLLQLSPPAPTPESAPNGTGPRWQP